MRNVFYLCLLLFMLTASSFTTQKSVLQNDCVNPYSCWSFADHYAHENINYKLASNSYAEDYDIWVWYYDYCMDGLWAPAYYAGCN